MISRSPLEAIQWVLAITLIINATHTEASQLETKTFVLKSEIEHRQGGGEEPTRIQLTEYYSFQQARGLIRLVRQTSNEDGTEEEQRGTYWVDKAEAMLLFQSETPPAKCTRVESIQRVWQDIGLNFLGIADNELFIGPAKLLSYLADKLQDDDALKHKDGHELDLFKPLKVVASDWSELFTTAQHQALPRRLKFTTMEEQWTTIVKFVSLDEVDLSSSASWVSLAIEPLSSCSLILAEPPKIVDYKRLSPFMRRLTSIEPIKRFMFEAEIKTSVPSAKSINVKVAYDERLAKLRADFAIPATKQTTLQLFDLKDNIVFHKLTLGETTKLVRNSCGASLMPSRSVTIGQLLMGSDSAQYLGQVQIGGASQTLARVYQSIGAGLPYWLDQQLAPKPVAEEIFVTLLYFSVTNGVDDKLLMVKVMRLAANKRDVLDEREISFKRFDWSLDAGPDDPSGLFSLARECPHPASRKVSLEIAGRLQPGQQFQDVRERNLALLAGLQNDLTLPTNRVYNLISKMTEQPPKIKLGLEFEVSPCADRVGTFRLLMDNDQVKKLKGIPKSIIENTMSFSQCYHFASQLESDQVFFVHEPVSNRCHLSERVEDDWLKMDKLPIGTMRKVPNQDGAKLENWLTSGASKWLSLPMGSNGVSSYAITRLLVDGVAIRGSTVPPRPRSPDPVVPDRPDIVPIDQVGSALIYVLFSLIFVAAVLLIFSLRERFTRRKSTDSTKQLVRFNSDHTIEMGNWQATPDAY